MPLNIKGILSCDILWEPFGTQWESKENHWASKAAFWNPCKIKRNSLETLSSPLINKGNPKETLWHPLNILWHQLNHLESIHYQKKPFELLEHQRNISKIVGNPLNIKGRPLIITRNLIRIKGYPLTILRGPLNWNPSRIKGSLLKLKGNLLTRLYQHRKLFEDLLNMFWNALETETNPLKSVGCPLKSF